MVEGQRDFSSKLLLPNNNSGAADGPSRPSYSSTRHSKPPRMPLSFFSLLTDQLESRILLTIVSTSRRQLTLPLRERGWGGRRPGAGRKPGPNPRVRHLSRPAISSRYPAHVTLRVRPGVPSLRSRRLVRRLEKSLARGCERGDFRVTQYSILANHAHFIVEARDADALGRGMKSLTRRLAHAVNGVFGRRGPVLADRYHLRLLKTPREVRRALAYVLLNARRHARWPGSGGRIDPASSGRWFDGWTRSARAELAGSGPGPPSVARPRSWLLERGWRRHGLVDPLETPGPARDAVRRR